MSPPPELKKFMAATQKAKENMLRARVQSGVAHGDPLDPLVIALADTVDVLGQMPAALEAAAAAGREHAMAEVEAGLATAVRKAVAATARATSFKQAMRWGIGFIAVFGTILAATAYFAYELPKSLADIQTERAYQRARDEFDIELADIRKSLPDIAAWASAIQSSKDQERARWAVANPDLVETIGALSRAQQSALVSMIREVPLWAAYSAQEKAPWPCITFEQTNRFLVNNRPAAVCFVGRNGW